VTYLLAFIAGMFFGALLGGSLVYNLLPPYPT
jgi:hypothetical protein